MVTIKICMTKIKSTFNISRSNKKNIQVVLVKQPLFNISRVLSDKTLNYGKFYKDPTNKNKKY